MSTLYAHSLHSIDYQDYQDYSKLTPSIHAKDAGSFSNLTLISEDEEEDVAIPQRSPARLNNTMQLLNSYNNNHSHNQTNKNGKQINEYSPDLSDSSSFDDRVSISDKSSIFSDPLLLNNIDYNEIRNNIININDKLTREKVSDINDHHNTGNYNDLELTLDDLDLDDIEDVSLFLDEFELNDDGESNIIFEIDNILTVVAVHESQSKNISPLTIINVSN